MELSERETEIVKAYFSKRIQETEYKLEHLKKSMEMVTADEQMKRFREAAKEEKDLLEPYKDELAKVDSKGKS